MDNENEQNYTESVTYLLNMGRKAFGDTIKAYYEGDPDDIPKNNFPCMIVEKIATTVNVQDAPTGHDAVTEQISIRIVFNKLDDSGASDDYDLTERKLRKIVEGRNPANGQFSTDSLMYVMRTDLAFGETIRNQDLAITYGINPRTDTLRTSEAMVLVTISEIIRVVR